MGYHDGTAKIFQLNYSLSTQKKDEIKLFDFGSSEIKESFVNNPDQGDPLESHKLYLNIVSHERMLPPLSKERDFANPKDDKTW